MTKSRTLADAGTAFTSVSATELAFVDGVTSAIQTQIDTKAPTSTTTTLTGTQTLTNKTLTSPVISTITTKGDLLGYDTALNRVPIGTNNQVLTADSAQALGLKWATVSGGGMTLLSTTTHSTASTTINVTPTGYNYLYILQTGFYNAGDTQKLRINADTGIFYNYLVQYWDGTAGTSSTAPTALKGQKQSSLLLYNNGTDATYYGTAVTIIYDPNNTGKDKVITNWSGGEDSATYTHNNFGTGSYLGSGALTSITLFGTASQAGTVYIYGVK